MKTKERQLGFATEYGAHREEDWEKEKKADTHPGCLRK